MEKLIVIAIIVLIIIVLLLNRSAGKGTCSGIQYTETATGKCLLECDRVTDSCYCNCNPKDDDCVKKCYELKAKCYMQCLGPNVRQEACDCECNKSD